MSEEKKLGWREKYPKANAKDRAELLEKMTLPCVKCGNDKPYLIDFHHINPEDKEYNISKLRYNLGHSDEVVINEIKKCVCLCANCHREFHHLYGQHPSNPEKALKEYLEGDSNDEPSL